MKYQSLVNNILSALYVQNNCDMKDTLTDLQELKEALEESHFAVIAAMEEIMNHNAEKGHMCPKCFGDVHVTYNQNETIEYQGMPVNERACSLVCSECGWSRDIDG